MIDFEALLGDRKKPWNWEDMDDSERLDFIATRMLAEDRNDSGITSHAEMKDSGILSESQMERRIRREVYSVVQEWGDIISGPEITPGVFGRIHRETRRTKGWDSGIEPPFQRVPKRR